MNVGKRLNALYLYKNNNKGKLYLSYHKRQWEGAVKTPDHVKRTMLQAGKRKENTFLYHTAMRFLFWI